MRIKQMLSKGCIVLGCGCLLIAALLLLQNAWTERNATNASTAALTAIAAQSSDIGDGDRDTILEGDTTDNGDGASTMTVAGASYCGVLEMTSINLELPIQADFSYDNLKSSPCIYIQDDNEALVIAAHNYAAHFGSLPQLSIGDAVTYTTLDGSVYAYTVSEIVTIEETDLAAIEGSADELVLFTCNINNNSQRVVVRCNLLLF